MIIQPFPVAQKHFAKNLKILINMDAPYQILRKIVFGTTFARMHSAKTRSKKTKKTRKAINIQCAVKPNAKLPHLLSNAPFLSKDANTIQQTATGISAT